MKKRYVITLIITILILGAIASVGIFQLMEEQGKNYEIAKVNEYNYFILKQENQYGVMDKQGNIVVKPEYEEVKIPNPEKQVFICYQEEKSKVLNGNCEEILNQYTGIQPIRLKNISSDLMYEKSVLKYSQDGKYGLINFEGKQITKPIYDEIESLPYKEGELLVKQDGKVGVINIKGNKITEIAYQEVKVDGYYAEENHYQHAGYIVSTKTEEGYRYGYLNNKGKEILKPEYNEVSRITNINDNDNAYLICAKNGQYGVNKNQELIVNYEYQSIQYDETNELLVVEKSKKYGIAKLQGQVIIPIKYSEIDITGMYVYAKNEQETTVYDKNGTQANISPNIVILNTSNNNYKIRINNENGTKYGLIDKNGKTLIEEKYNYMEYLYDNYFLASNEEGKLGIVDDMGKTKVEAIYNSMQKIQGTDLIETTLAQNKTTQIYARTMEKICEMENANIQKEKDIIKIYNETQTRYFNEQGKELKNTEVYPENALFVAVKDNQYGYVDRAGKQLVDYQYEKATEFNQYGFAGVKKEGKWGVIDSQGKEIVTPVYELESKLQPFFIGSYYKVSYGLGEFYYTNDGMQK